MMVSFDIYAVLNDIELIVSLVLGVFIFVKREETYDKIMRLICVCICILFIINVFQLTLEIQMEKSYALTIYMIIICFVEIASIAFQLGKNKK